MAHVSSGTIRIDARGRIRAEVISSGPDGAMFRSRQRSRRPANTETAGEGSGEPTSAAAAYDAMTRAQARIWNAYAATSPLCSPPPSAARPTTGRGVFVGLTTRFMQVNPGGTIPLIPPTVPFAGDNVVVTAAAGNEGIAFTASGPNAAPAKTEILLQPLECEHRSAGRSYRTAAFTAFTAGCLSYSVPVAPGRYACAYRFVNAATGQAITMMEIGVVLVP